VLGVLLDAPLALEFIDVELVSNAFYNFLDSLRISSTLAPLLRG